MDKIISCYNLTKKCYFVAIEDSEDKVIETISEHIEKEHEIEMTEDLREKAKFFIRMAA